MAQGRVKWMVLVTVIALTACDGVPPYWADGADAGDPPSSDEPDSGEASGDPPSSDEPDSGEASGDPPSSDEPDSGEASGDSDSDGDVGGDSDGDTDGDMDGDSDLDGDADGDVEPLVASALQPLAVGHMWSYEVKAMTGDPLCAAGFHNQRVVGSGFDMGRDFFEVENFCKGPHTSNMFLAHSNQRVEQFIENEWITIIDIPIVDAHSWSVFGYAFTWRSVGTVTVQAGTFDSCFERYEPTGELPAMTYCKDVGKVRQILPGDYEAELISYQL